MNTRLVHFDATDGISLSGLLYEPSRPKGRAAIWLHGNSGSSVFDSERTNRLGALFTRGGVALLAFDNRGSHFIRIAKKRISATETERRLAGMTYELIRDCIADIDGAVRFLRKSGSSDITILGHSTGANKICVYGSLKPRNQINRYVLVAGGDDTGIYRNDLGPRRFDAMLAKSREMVNRGRGADLAPENTSAFPISYRSLYDTINPDGDYNVFPFREIVTGDRLSRHPLFRAFAALRKPTLVVYGSEEPYCFTDAWTALSILQDHVEGRNNFDFYVVEGADHGFHGYEDELVGAVLRWAKG
jgi:Predicted hydrolases or acyltransferases (alpha/beta hydrolase superfamily)